jgi:hypothetical protein
MIAKETLPKILTIKGKKKAKIPQIKKRAVARPYIIRELFTPCCVGHATVIRNLGAPVGKKRIIQDFLVDSSGLSKGGESVNPVIQAGLNASRKMIFSIMPEACKKRFKVSMPAGLSRGYLSFAFGRSALHWAAGGNGFYDAYAATVIFNGLTGTPPVITYSWFSISNGNNNAFHVYIEGEFTANFTFTDIQIVCKYPGRNFLPQFDFYKLLSYSTPFTIPSTDDVCYAMFGYESPTLNDLGQIIEII